MNPNAPQRIRITEKGWAGYNGYFGTVEFKDALSVHPVDYVTRNQLGSIIRIEAVDTGEQAGVAANMQANHETAAEVTPELEHRLPDAEPEKEVEAPVHTRESLEAAADKHGIAGLRAIAEPLGIKGRGIAELIDEILAYQGQK